jgi:uncharacterized protein (TIGR02611 family)
VRWQRAPRTSSTYLYGRKVAIGVVGTAVTAIGVAMLALPGPGIVVVLLGLAILGAEFAWARAVQRRMRDEASRTAARTRARARLKRLRSRGPRTPV